MGSYTNLETVRASAGRLAPAWDDDTYPSLADLETFIDLAEAEIDAALGGIGISLPADTATAAAARPLATDLALIRAIEATWPSGGGNQTAERMLERALGRAYGQDGKLNLAAILDIAAVGSPAAAGATDLWTDENLCANESLPWERLPVGQSMRL